MASSSAPASPAASASSTCPRTTLAATTARARRRRTWSAGWRPCCRSTPRSPSCCACCARAARSVALIAFQGVYQQTPADKPAQMLRLSLDNGLAVRAGDQRQQVRAEHALPPPGGRAEDPRLRAGRAFRARVLQPVAPCRPIRARQVRPPRQCPACAGRRCSRRRTRGGPSAASAAAPTTWADGRRRTTAFPRPRSRIPAREES